MNWSGDERRKGSYLNQSDHDVLIRIEQCLQNFKKTFDDHSNQDNFRLGEHNLRIKSIEKAYWMGIGALAVFQLLVSILIK